MDNYVYVFVCLFFIRKDHFVYAPNPWETTLHCNGVSHWLGAYTDWSLNTREQTFREWKREIGSAFMHVCTNGFQSFGPICYMTVEMTMTGVVVARDLSLEK